MGNVRRILEHDIALTPQKTEAEVERIVLHKTDGTVEVVTKGMVISPTFENEQLNGALMQGCNISGQEVIDVCVMFMGHIAQQAVEKEIEDEE